MGFPGGSDGKESACSAGDLGLIPGLGRSPGEGNGYPLQYSGLENSMDCIVQGVIKSRTRLSDFHFHFTFRFFLTLPNSIPCVWRLLAGWFPLSCELCKVKDRVLCFVCVLAGVGEGAGPFFKFFPEIF